MIYCVKRDRNSSRIERKVGLAESNPPFLCSGLRHLICQRFGLRGRKKLRLVRLLTALFSKNFSALAYQNTSDAGRLELGIGSLFV